MASAEEKAWIRRKASEGLSVNEIADDMDLPKSTVYYHFRKEVGQKQKESGVAIPEEDEVIGEICGVFAGDGSFYKSDEGHYRIRIALNVNEKYWKRLQNFLTEKLQKEPLVNKQPSYNRVYLRYYSKELYEMLKSYLEWSESDKTGSIRLLDNTQSVEFNEGFLRGLMDTDGYRNSSGNKMTFNSVSKKLISDVSSILNKFEVQHGVRIDPDDREGCRDMYRAVIRSGEIQKFDKKVNPRHPGKSILE